MRKKSLRAALFGAALLLGSGLLLARCQRTRPYNVILISLDTLRADRLGSYGFKQWGISPELDRLSEKSIVFLNAFSTASVTTASHMSMFTGLQPTEHRLNDIVSKSPRTETLPPMLHSKIQTLPEILRGAGYQTARFAFSRDYFLDSSIGFGRGFDELYPYGLDSNISAEAINSWLSKEKEKPFFAFIHSKRPHSPFLFSDETLKEAEGTGRLDPAYRGPVVASQSKWSELVSGKDWSGNFIPGVMPDCFYFESRVRKDSEADKKRISQLYNLAVHETDRLLGLVLRKLDKEGLLESTIIVVVSDHGEQFLEHGTLSHIQLHKEETHIPFVLYLPGALAASVKRNRVQSDVQTSDILPTVLGQLGLPVPKGLSGKDLGPVFRGEAERAHEEVFSFNLYSMISRASAVRTPEWTLITSDEGDKLYDRGADPLESRNIAEARPEVLEKLRARLKLFELASYSFDPDKL